MGEKTVNVFVRRSPEGKPYFEKKVVKPTTPDKNPPPTIDELPPLDEDGNPIEGFQGSLDEVVNGRGRV